MEPQTGQENLMDKNERDLIAYARAHAASAHALLDEVERGIQREERGRKEERGRYWLDRKPRYEDDTVPANLDEYIRWLRGYVANGGKPTHTCDYPWARARMRYATRSPLRIDSDYDFGARARRIIVAEGVSVHRSDPCGAFQGYGHDELYYMDGYRQQGGVVPVYSDPEFAEFHV
jgi:hypothetical protein